MRSLRLAFFLTLLVLAVELAAGLLSHSLALVADAGHVLTDVFALGLAWFAAAQAQRPDDGARTYGYHRVGTLAAMVNGATLILVVGGVAIEAARRFQHPELVSGAVVVGGALLAMAINGFIALRLHADHDHQSLNVRAATLHVVGDLAGSAGAVVAGVVILTTGWLYADPLVSVAICGLVALGAWRIVRESVLILLEGAPAHVDMERLRTMIAAAAGVESVHDLHVWSLSPAETMLSCHVVVPESLMSEAEHTMRHLEQSLCAEFGIGHTTIQLESCHPCSEVSHGPGEHNHPHPEPLGHAHAGTGAGHRH